MGHDIQRDIRSHIVPHIIVLHITALSHCAVIPIIVPHRCTTSLYHIIVLHCVPHCRTNHSTTSFTILLSCIVVLHRHIVSSTASSHHIIASYYRTASSYCTAYPTLYQIG